MPAARPTDVPRNARNRILRPPGLPPMDWMKRLSHFEPSTVGTDCQVFDGHRNHHGYGRMMYNGQLVLTHRIAWIERNGAIPTGFYVCHRCDNPPCFAADHLWLGTHDENMADRNRKGRCRSGIRNIEKTHCKHGHEFTPANTRLRYRADRPGVSRRCVACEKADRLRRSRQQVVERLNVRAEDAAA